MRCMFEVGGGWDVEALAAAAPGPALAAALAGLDLLALNGYARVVVLQAWERQVSWSSAGMFEAMGYVARSPMGVPDSAAEVSEHFGEFASVEVGAALSLSPRCADVELAFAWQLAERLSGTRVALSGGRVSLATARMIAHETASLSDVLARQAEDFILTLAGGLTRQQLERRLRRKVLQLDPGGAEERRQDAQRGRRVRFDTGPDGTGCIAGYDLPVAEVAGARAFIKDIAKTLRREGDGRTLAQLETDVYLDLLQGRHLNARAVQPRVELVAPLETWLRLGDEPAELAGLGPISSAVMDEIRAAAAAESAAPATEGAAAGDGDSDGIDRAERTERRTDSDTGGAGHADARHADPRHADGRHADDRHADGRHADGRHADPRHAGGGIGLECAWTVTRDGVVIRHGTGRYRPTRALRRTVETLHRSCRHPGCTRPADGCDLDHLTEHRLGGPTCACNLIPLCRRHHRAKHQAGWWWTTDPSGTLNVQSPLGHTYASGPDPLPGSDPPATTRPAQTQPTEPEPVGVAPTEFELAAPEPAEFGPAEFGPAEFGPAGGKPAESEAQRRRRTFAASMTPGRPHLTQEEAGTPF
jgi:uncharacterized protein DUF222